MLKIQIDIDGTKETIKNTMAQIGIIAEFCDPDLITGYITTQKINICFENKINRLSFIGIRDNGVTGLQCIPVKVELNMKQLREINFYPCDSKGDLDLLRFYYMIDNTIRKPLEDKKYLIPAKDQDGNDTFLDLRFTEEFLGDEF